MPAIKITNLEAFMRAFDATEASLDKAVEKAIAAVSLAVERQAKVNASGPIHKPKQRRKAWDGEGPNVVTGTLRRSIAGTITKGFDSYTAVIGASVEYARAVELGSPRWKSGAKYPYLNPAVSKLAENGTINRVFTNYLMLNLRG